MIEFKQGDKCAFEGCTADAEFLACGRGETGHPNPAPYCDTHGRMIADEDSPEYLNDCPNCGCLHGVN